MQIKSIITTLAIAAPLVSALGRARVVNECDSEVTAWAVGSEVDGPHHLRASGGGWSEGFRHDEGTGGISIKITHDRDGLYTGAAQLNFAYSLDGETVWYDMSNVFGDAFEGDKLVVASEDTSCPSIVWEEGVSPGGSQVKDCTSEKNVTLTLCA